MDNSNFIIQKEHENTLFISLHHNIFWQLIQHPLKDAKLMFVSHYLGNLAPLEIFNTKFKIELGKTNRYVSNHLFSEKFTWLVQK